MRTPVVCCLGLVTVSAVVGAVIWSLPTAQSTRESKKASSAPLPPPEVVLPAQPAHQVRTLPPGIAIHFRECTREAGVDFTHVDGRTELQHLMDSTGAGVAWIDFDRDGLLDLFLVQGNAFVPPFPDKPETCKLYRNLGSGRFEDVTKAAGVDHAGCGQGAAVGDFDNDGFPDLFLTCYGKPNVLFRNIADGKGGRRFQDITMSAGLAGHPDWKMRPNWSTSAAFLDYDNDGKLDLFVCSYVKIDLAAYPHCPGRKRPLGPCSPSQPLPAPRALRLGPGGLGDTAPDRARRQAGSPQARAAIPA